MIFVVSIDGDFSPLQVEKLRHEILNLRGVVSVEWQEAARQSVQADGATPRAYCKVHETYYDVSMGCAACPPRR